MNYETNTSSGNGSSQIFDFSVKLIVFVRLIITSKIKLAKSNTCMMPFDQNFFGGNFESLLVAAAVAVARVVNVDLYREKRQNN